MKNVGNAVLKVLTYIRTHGSLKIPRPPELFESKTKDDHSVDNDTVRKGRRNSSLKFPKQENDTLCVLR